MAAQVHAHHVVPVGFGHAREHLVAADARVVDEHVHVAECFARRVDDPLRGVDLRDVVRIRKRAVTAAFTSTGDLVDDRLRGVVPDVVDDDRRAFGRERQRVFAPEAPPPAPVMMTVRPLQIPMLVPRGS